MAKDIIGNDIKVGDTILFQGITFNVKSLDENRVLGGKQITGRGVSGMKIPDNITLEVDLQFDAEKPFNGYVVKTPPQKVSSDSN